MVPGRDLNVCQMLVANIHSPDALMLSSYENEQSSVVIGPKASITLYVQRFRPAMTKGLSLLEQITPLFAFPQSAPLQIHLSIPPISSPVL